MMGRLLLLYGLGWGVTPSPRGARWCFLSQSFSSCQAEWGKIWLDPESSPQLLAVLGTGQTRPLEARCLFLLGISVPLIKQTHGVGHGSDGSLSGDDWPENKGHAGFFFIFKEAKCDCSSQ